MIRAPLVLAAALTLSLVTYDSGPLRAQTPTGAVTGVVRDSTSLPLEGVEIRAIDRATGFAYRAASSTTGRYWLRGLPPGNYDLAAERLGLRATTAPRIELPVGRTISIDFVLLPAAVELEPLRVEIQAATVETARSEVAFTVDRDRIGRLPEESRNFVELARLVPGATRGTEAGGDPRNSERAVRRWAPSIATPWASGWTVATSPRVSLVTSVDRVRSWRSRSSR